MAVEQDRLVTRGSVRAICLTTTASWGGCSWRIATKRTG
jgi:hypothetical protein